MSPRPSQCLDALRRNLDAAAKQSLSLAEKLSLVNERISNVFDGLEHASDASKAFAEGTHQAAGSTENLDSEVHKLRAALVELRAGIETMARTLETMGELDSRIRANHDADQASAVVQQMGDLLRTITKEGTAVTDQTARAAELFDGLRRGLQATEGETRRAAEALRVLANEAEKRTQALQQRQGSGLGFWSRGR